MKERTVAWRISSRLILLVVTGLLARAALAGPPTGADLFGQKTTELFEAMKKKDAAALEKILAADYIYTAVNGESTNKQGFIDATSKLLTIESFKLTPVAVHLYGDATAVVVYRNSLHSTVNGKPWNPLLTSTDTWVKQGGGWVLASHHVSMLLTNR